MNVRSQGKVVRALRRFLHDAVKALWPDVPRPNPEAVPVPVEVQRRR